MPFTEKMMSSFFFSLVCGVALLACACASAAPTASALEAVSQPARLDSAVEIHVFDQVGTRIGSGSGFFVEPPSSYQGNSSQMARVATCLHVIAAAHQITIKTSDGAVYPARFITQVGFDADLSVFSVALPASQVEAVQIAEREARRNEAVTIRHSPLGKGILTSRGSILRRVTYAGPVVSPLASVYYNGSLLQLSTPLYPGSSGGGVFDHEGQLLGIAEQMQTTGYYLIPAARLRQLPNLPPPLPPAEFSARFLTLQREGLRAQLQPVR